MKIGFFGLIAQEDPEFIKNNLPEHSIKFYSECLTESFTPEDDFEIISVFVNCQVTKKIIDAMPNLKLIVTRSTGYDHIDIEYAKQKGITVCNVPSYGSNTVAEFAFGLILSLSRRIPEAVTRLKQDGKFDYANLCGFDLFGKTLGVIGTGKIGKNVIKIADGFGMKVLGFDAFPDQDFAKIMNFEYVGLEKLLQGSDVITIHTPYNPQTHHLINKDNITLIKKTAFLINTARGAIVETESLYEAIRNGKIAGAALDVLEEEGMLKDEEILLEQKLPLEEVRLALENKALIDLPQVIVTPHMAFYTKEAEQAILETTVKNIRGFVNEKLENVVSDTPPSPKP